MNGMAKSNYLIATDLDGTLLDHHSYEHAPAEPALALCKQDHIPVVFNTSKTAVESRRLRNTLGNRHPFIVENGSAALIPAGYFNRMPQGCVEAGDYWVHRFGKGLAEIQAALADMKRERHFQFSGFSDWSPEQIVERTGLSLSAASEAKQREYSEPLLWQDDEKQLQAFHAELTTRGMKLLQGGRFLHVLGDTDKGKALNWLKDVYEHETGKSITLVALGDSDNDIDMLEAADIAVVVRSPVREAPELRSNNRVVHTRAFGPSGWNEAITQLFQPRET